MRYNEQLLSRSYLRVQAVHVLMRIKQNTSPVGFVAVESLVGEWSSASGAESCGVLYVFRCPVLEKKVQEELKWDTAYYGCLTWIYGHPAMKHALHGLS